MWRREAAPPAATRDHRPGMFGHVDVLGIRQSIPRHLPRLELSSFQYLEYLI